MLVCEEHLNNRGQTVAPNATRCEETGQIFKRSKDPFSSHLFGKYEIVFKQKNAPHAQMGHVLVTLDMSVLMFGKKQVANV